MLRENRRNRTNVIGIMMMILIGTLATVTAKAATFTVTNTADSGAGSLRQAVLDSNAAAGSDTIVFDSSFNSPQTITLASVITINPATDDSLTITGPGANLLTVSGNNVTRHFINSSGDTASISGLTLTAGRVSGSGGAIQNNGILTVTNLVINANMATNNFGGGIFSGGGTTLNVVNCIISNNTSLLGGGIINNGGTVAITGSTISNNITTSTDGSFRSGGGIFAASGVTNLTNTVISGNQATFASGVGGIASVGNPQLTITNSTIMGNSATGDGGGIVHSPIQSTAFLNISNSTISNNTANTDNNNFGDGGGVFLGGQGPATISGSTINDNRANTGTETGSGAGNGGGINV